MRVRRADGTLVRELTVPGTMGTHRVNWDLRHGGPGVSDTWERHDSPVLARPIEPWGPWVSPGIYTVSIESGGQRGETRVEVRGDPDMPMLTQAMYETREQFMLDAIALTTQISDVMRQHGMSGGGGGGGGFRGPAGPPRSPEDRLRAARRLVQQVYSSLNGGAVRPGSLYPPTQTQREQLQRARDLLADAIAGLG